jgi:hypothetical protein
MTTAFYIKGGSKMKKKVLEHIVKDMKKYGRNVTILELDNTEMKHDEYVKQMLDVIDSHYLDRDIYRKDEDTYLIIIFDEEFSMYNEVLKRAIKSGDKVLLQYVISSIGKVDEYTMRNFIEKLIGEEITENNKISSEEELDKAIKDGLESLAKEAEALSSKPINDDIARKIVKDELEDKISDCELIIKYVTDIKKSVLNNQFKDTFDEFVYNHQPVIKSTYYNNRLAAFNHNIYGLMIVSNIKDAEQYCNDTIVECVEERYKYIEAMNNSNAKIRYTCYES